MVPIDTDEALAELKAGRIDAMFYVAGYPVKLFSEGVREQDGLALVPDHEQEHHGVLSPGGDPGPDLPVAAEGVDSVAVKSVLISFDFRRRDCETIGKFAKTLVDNMSWLVSNGHPKWKAVDLNYPLKGWEQYDCVRKYLGKSVEPTVATERSGSGNPLMDAIKQVLGD